jgi:nucleotide-binding universal stress UspA family protein
MARRQMSVNGASPDGARFSASALERIPTREVLLVEFDARTRASARTLRRAASLARRRDADLIVGYVTSPPRSMNGFTGVVHANEIKTDVFSEAVVHLIDQDVQWQIGLAVGKHANGLVDIADTMDASAIVVSAPRRSPAGWLRRLIGRDVLSKLTRVQGRPVIVIPRAA